MLEADKQYTHNECGYTIYVKRIEEDIHGGGDDLLTFCLTALPGPLAGASIPPMLIGETLAVTDALLDSADWTEV